MKNVNIIMPSVYFGIAGGYKVIFDYANFLHDNNHKIRIYFDLQQGHNSHHIPTTLCLIIRKYFLKKYYRIYNINKKIELVPLDILSEKYIENADCIIATSPNITYFVNSLSSLKGNKFEFVQGFETWDGASESYVKKSYSLMKNIVVSKWLKNIVDKNSNQNSYLIQNGIDTKLYNIKVNVSDRYPHSICMIYNNGENKGCKYAINAIKSIKKIYPDTIVEFAGTPKRPKNLPKWIKYKRMASDIEMVDMYNNNAIFICSSIVEGFGLPGLEAMACGCALITTNCFGPMDYCNNDSAIICKSKNEESIFSAIKGLFKDDKKRKMLALKGAQNAKNYDIGKSRKLFMECLNEK